MVAIFQGDLVSVIVPVYNVDRYLHRCIDSIIAQDYENLEIILVDDGSTDSSPVICDDYASKDSRIKVYHRENRGVSSARNFGVEASNGKYVSFIDSDDYIASNFISTLYGKIIEYAADISVCSYYEFTDNKIKDTSFNSLKKDLVLTNLEAMRDIFTLPNYTKVVPWNKLYKKEIFQNNSVIYPINRRHEDDATTYKLYYYSNKIVYCNIPLYYYYQSSTSFMGQKYHAQRLDILLALKETEEFVKENNIDLNQEVKFNELLRLLTVLNSMVDTKCIDKKVFEDIRTIIKKDKEVYLKNPYLDAKHKVAVKSLIFSRKLYIIIRKLFVFKNKYIRIKGIGIL